MRRHVIAAVIVLASTFAVGAQAPKKAYILVQVNAGAATAQFVLVEGM